MLGRNVQLILLIPVCLALENLIINGNDTKIEKYPYAVAIYWKSTPLSREKLICGGVILTDNWIVTSAQCIRRVGTVTVRAGKNILSSPNEDQQYRQVGMQIAHGSYRRPSVLNPIPKDDIALFKLSQPLKMNKSIRAIRLPLANKNVTGRATVIGWGGDSSSSNSDILQAVVLPIIQAPYCQDTLRSIPALKNAKVRDNQICIGRIGEKTSACGKDTGGPLVQDDKGRNPKLVGIISWSDSKCGKRGLPTVCTTVSSYVTWINGFIENKFKL